jgi:hypothetical protein
MLAAVSLLWPLSAAADAIDLPYSGRLVDENGAPVAGPVDMMVLFYTSEEIHNPISSGVIFTSVPLEDGVFQLKISLPSRDFHKIFPGPDKPTWVEITDGTNGKVYPRQMLGAIPYALKVPVDGTSIGWNTAGELQLLGEASVNKVGGESLARV